MQVVTNLLIPSLTILIIISTSCSKFGNAILARIPTDSYYSLPDFLFPETDLSPVYLNDYLDNPTLGRKIAKVKIEGYENVDMGEAGYITFDPTYQSTVSTSKERNSTNPHTKLLVIDVNGGPGATSQYGNFEELGPFSLSADGSSLVPRNSTWNLHYHLLFVDNPVGTGFSYTQDVRGFVTDMTDVADDLYAFLELWFAIYTDYQPNPFYVTGESYAGKYVPSIANKIHFANLERPKIRINLAGISIGDGLMEPITQIPGYGSLLFNEGMASHSEFQYWADQESQIIKYLADNDTVSAFRIFDYLLNGDFFPYPTYFYNTTHLTDYFNFNQPSYPANPWQTWINTPAVREAIHVGNRTFWTYNQTVEAHLLQDWFRAVSDVLPILIQSYKVLIYNGQNDIILSAPQCQNFLQTLQCGPICDNWRLANKTVWQLPNSTTVAGYAITSQRFNYVIVREAGHLLPQDQPERALEMITRFVDGRSF